LRWLALLFVVLIAALQYPMWLGKGGWLQVRETDRQLAAQREENAKLKARNEGLDADVRDLKTGSEAIEERARSELGMIRSDEVFFQVQPGVVTPAKAPPAKVLPVPGRPPAAAARPASAPASAPASVAAPASAPASAGRPAPASAPVP
jgi:cell division protein FtsB